MSFFFIISFLFFLFWEGDVPLFCTLDGRISGGKKIRVAWIWRGLRPCSNAMNIKYLHKEWHLLVHPLVEEVQHLPGWNICYPAWSVSCVLYLHTSEGLESGNDWNITSYLFCSKVFRGFLAFFFSFGISCSSTDLQYQNGAVSCWGWHGGNVGWYWASILQRQFF